MRPLILLVSTVVITLTSALWAQAPLVSASEQAEFFDTIRAYCGKAYPGKVAGDNAPASDFAGISLKHDHRHKDGSDDALTLYCGHTSDAG